MYIYITRLALRERSGELHLCCGGLGRLCEPGIALEPQRDFGEVVDKHLLLLARLIYRLRVE